MNRLALIVGLTASLSATGSLALPSRTAPEVGDLHEIVVSYETAQAGSDGSSGSSRGRQAVLERVITADESGLEMEFDLTSDATAEDRALVWKFPARILQRSNGALELLNGEELEERVDRWLAAADMTREMCGRWIFTWNAFRIECDPASVIDDIEGFNLLAADLRPGAAYQHPGALGSGTLSRTSEGPDGSSYAVTLEADAEAVRRARAEADVVVGDIMQAPVTLETALGERSKDVVSGTVEITFDVDAQGDPIRRTVVTTLRTVKPDGVWETDRQTEVVERRVAP